jgi:hypothetical protein
VYSQNGEDGIIAWLLQKLPTPHHFCVEFGAWDGKRLSNTFNLVSSQGWRAIYIEGDQEKFRELQKTAAEFPNIIAVKAFVAANGTYSLDAILSGHDIPVDFELLSIDVDGVDYDIWEAMKNFRPGIVVIEHNHTMPPCLEYIDRGGQGFIGSSATSLHLLARRKGYDLFGCTLTNSIFLRDDLFAAAHLQPTTVPAAFDTSDVCYALRNHSGELVLSNPSVAKSVRGVRYASAMKRVKHEILREPSVYLLGEAHAQPGVLTRLLRSIFSRS